MTDVNPKKSPLPVFLQAKIKGSPLAPRPSPHLLIIRHSCLGMALKSRHRWSRPLLTELRENRNCPRASRAWRMTSEAESAPTPFPRRRLGGSDRCDATRRAAVQISAALAPLFIPGRPGGAAAAEFSRQISRYERHRRTLLRWRHAPIAGAAQYHQGRWARGRRLSSAAAMGRVWSAPAGQCQLSEGPGDRPAVKGPDELQTVRTDMNQMTYGSHCETSLSTYVVNAIKLTHWNARAC